MLAGADAAGLKTAHGGLLRLLQNLGGWLAGLLGAPVWWSTSLLPFTSGQTVQFGFHVFVGLLMAVVYAYLLEPVLPGRPWMKGLIYAALAWLLNAMAVLPLIGEGIAGAHHLDAAGMIGFAVAHTAFFVLLTTLYARLCGAPYVHSPAFPK